MRVLLAVTVTLLAAMSSAAAVTLAGGPAPAAAATPYRVLFDASHGETAGNADWIISTAQPDPLAQNANPTSEASWTGAISAWGVALQRTGRYSLATLPAGGRISYGDAGNAQDLSRYSAFVLPEPNVVFSSAEKTAIMTFVRNGGGLFLVSDHTGSDRNNDGWDSPKILNDLMSNNSVDSTDPFGFSIDLLDIANENPSVIGSAAGSDPIIRGPFGTATGTIVRDGTTATLKPADNAGVRGEIFRSGFSASGTTGAAVASATFGSGRVLFWGDSSPIDDGTGQSGNTLFNGWNDPAGTDATLALNGTEWLASGTGGSTGSCPSPGQQSTTSFENGNAAPWTASAGVITNSSAEPAHTGTWKAWLDGYGITHTDTLSTTVSIPAGCTATMSYYLHIDTAETTTTTAYDKLTLKLANTVVTTFSNLNANTGYAQRSVSLSSLAGQTVSVIFTGVEDSSRQTSFVIDDITLTLS
ncbi:hydrolase [Jatrophihabitans sp.]|uniref:hydrolase n=1 Tax=Jatrophihabitans sp. TaxID=1932789 RepID=UPI002B721505|nr:hypothetical protein [Jatrophihabitans sp.]